LFIVEGITDKTCLGSVLDQLLSNQEVRFELSDGDIATKTENTPANIVAKIGNIVKDFSDNKFKPKDFLEVVHLVDTDGAYIIPEKVIFSDAEKPYYTDNNILTNNVNEMQRRNVQKTAILNRLISLNKVWGIIPYSVYFFSCNLDHVLHNNANLTRTEKTEYANRFEDQYDPCPEMFVDSLNNDVCAVPGDYEETWKFIKIDEHSLQRFTNFQLYFTHPKFNRE
jgi:hypothetical protein